MTDHLRIATSEADARAAEAVELHHARMAGELAMKAASLAAAARAARPADSEEARLDLVRWCRDELVPHALAEESTMYRAAGSMPRARLLVEAMLVEHQRIIGLVDRLDTTSEPVAAAALARALRELFEAHLAKENDQILPLLLASPDVAVAELLGGMHELLGPGESDRSPGPVDEDGCGSTGHTCGCAETDGPASPELDAREIPHAIRHATIFGALDGVQPGAGLVLIAPHDPLPLLAQLEQRAPEAFAVDYLERGPETWRLSLMRLA
ncbi:DUF2249 domain-containing protein [Nocardioides sp.]|uniref:DUF2249 domain-containing protein n=1 Tax=Nocardioides sp. TaxID=35761 RepID=UPI00273268E2|nr:DUF2249 domain-containing protein [Nocardioides sp.]MDP3892394.1 DUF2249 domain-containing protein [Nocardioides sp.]